MEYINLNSNLNTIHEMSLSFILKLTHVKEVWLFNCFEGCQHVILKHSIKISQISKIIILDLNIKTISGLLGILSSLSLSKRSKPLHIYGPIGLAEYLDLGKKYSHTNFCYSVYLYSLSSGLIIDHCNYRIYVMIKHHFFELLVLANMKPGKFNIMKATNFYIIPGPLYGKVKNNFYFILPDGSTLGAICFLDNNYPGIKSNTFNDIYHTRRYVENSIDTNILVDR